MNVSVLLAALVLGNNSAAPPASQPVIAWAAGPLDVKVAFKATIDPQMARDLVGKSIPFGTDDARTPLGSLRIAAASLADDGRTLVLATDPHPREATYHLIVPDRQAPIDAAYHLRGVEVAWSEGQEDAKPAWTGWWPDINAAVTRKMTEGSVEHDRQIAAIQKPGRLVLRTSLTLPKGTQTLQLSSNRPFEVALGYDANETSADDGKGTQSAAPTLESTGDPVELAVTIQTGGDAPLRLAVTQKGGAGASDRPLTPDQQMLPWVPPAPPTPAAPTVAALDLAGGDRQRGEAVFTSEEAKCATCHKIRGQGGDVGPDLSDLHARRDAAAIYREIAEPSAQIDPNYVPYTVALQGGQVVAGIVRAEGPDSIKVLDTEGKATVIRRSEIEELRPSSTSIMPVGLAGALGEAKMRDLVTYLLAPPPGQPKSAK